MKNKLSSLMASLRKKNRLLARILFLAAFLSLSLASLAMQASTAQNIVPSPYLIDKSTSVGFEENIPAECSSLSLTKAINSNQGAVKGKSTSDLIRGSSANQTINGKDGDDCIIGGGGADKIDGGRGYDVCIGGPGDDTFKNCEVVIEGNPTY